MPGRHSVAPPARSRALPALLVIGAAVLIAVGGFIVSGNASRTPTAADACAGTVVVRVAAAPEIAPVVDEATQDLEDAGADVDGACIDYQVERTAPDQVLSGATSRPDKAPHLWVPDAAVWLTRAALGGANPALLSDSLGTSPVVVAGRDVSQPSSWLEVGKTTVAFLDPLTSSPSTAALLSAFGELSVTGASEQEMGAMMVPLAQRYGAQPDKPRTIEEVAQAAAQGTYGVMSEQQLVSLQHSGEARDFSAAVPKSGTMLLDYPLAALSPEGFARDAGGQLAVYLAGSRGAELLARSGFRDSQGEPLGSGEGLGKASFSILPLPEPKAVEAAIRQWGVLTVPSRSIAVVDVSGSMDSVERGQSRISLAVGAAHGALGLFPDNSSIGLWAFSSGLGGRNRDYLPLVPVRALGSTVGGATQRDALRATLRRLPRMTGGGTGLYDTTLAAVRTVQSSYDARAVNSVILLTDGRNDDRNSLSLAELLRTIELERDPARPVSVIAVGMGPEADVGALRRIAGVTGGRSYLARDPADIGGVFIDAMLRR